MRKINRCTQTFSVATLSTVLLSSIIYLVCKQAARDGSSLVIEPGVGIRGVVELGMTLRDIKRNNPDMIATKIEETGGTSIVIPCIGFRSELDDGQDTISTLFFFVGSSGHAPDGIKRFSGSLQGGVLFTETNGLARSKVVQLFGQTENTTTLDAYPYGVSAVELNDASSMSITRHHLETLRYPRHGVAFNLSSNNVVQVVVWRPTQPEKRGRSESAD